MVDRVDGITTVAMTKRIKVISSISIKPMITRQINSKDLLLY